MYGWSVVERCGRRNQSVAAVVWACLSCLACSTQVCPQSPQRQAMGPELIIRAQLIGPECWNEAIKCPLSRIRTKRHRQRELGAESHS